MLEIIPLIYALGVVLIVAVTAWLVSVARQDVSIVDSLWSLMILASVVAYIGFSDFLGRGLFW